VFSLPFIPVLTALLLVGSPFLKAENAAPKSASNSFVETYLVCDPLYYKNQGFNKTNQPQLIQDENMIDAWGIALRPPGAGGHIWINNAMNGSSVEYIGDVNGIPLHQDGQKIVRMDLPQWTDHGFAVVTGLAYNAAADIKGQPVEFPVSGEACDRSTNPPSLISGGTKGSAAFAFVTEDGCVNAWRQNTKIAMSGSPIMINYSKTSPHPGHANCVFSGCAMTTNGYTSEAFKKEGGNHFFATDFRNNSIRVFDNMWKDVTSLYHFQALKNLTIKDPDSGQPMTMHPFNIVALRGHLFVTYSRFAGNSDEGMEEEDGIGPGFGHVAEFSEDGKLIRDYRDKGLLNAPWGVTIAPPKFGKFGGALLVANLGDGTILAFNRNTGKFIDQLRDTKGEPISIDRIWGLTFGNGVSLGDANSLYFTAGPNNEFNGLFGKLTVAATAPKPLATSQSSPAAK